MNGHRPLVTFAGCCLIVAALYFAKVVLMPLALALLFAFLLAPVVDGLSRRGVPHVLAVSLVVVFAFVAAAAGAAALTWQARSLVAELPRYRDNIKAKIADVREISRMPIPKDVKDAIDEISQEIANGDSSAPAGTSPNEQDEPVPVEVTNDSNFAEAVAPILGPLATAGLVIVLVTFLLLRRGEVRDRIVRLVGLRRIASTTEALDEAGRRVSRYILTQTFVNGTFGAGIGVGLFLVGVEYAILFGILAATLRFIPYVGPWLAAILPVALSVATSPGWTEPLFVLGLFLVLELSSNLVMEPLLYGTSAGVSEVAILVAVAFWTWLWGPVGFVLATPLTVCIVVAGKHVPALNFLWILLSNEPVIATDKGFYHHVLVRDPDAAAAIAAENIRADALDAGFDEILLPALTHARNDRRRGEIGEEEEKLVYSTVREIADDLGAEEPETLDADGPRAGAAVLAAIDGEADELALVLLGQRLSSDGMGTRHVEADRRIAETASLIGEKKPAVAVIGAIAPGGLSRSASLCRRLRARYPDLPILVARWGGASNSAEAQALLAAGADRVAVDVAGARKAAVALAKDGRDPRPDAATPETV